MPRTTHAYPFEEDVFNSAAELSLRLTGEKYRSFLIHFDVVGAVQAIQFASTELHLSPMRDQLAASDAAYLFYDPFDVPEYAWLEWKDISREVMERFLGSTFEAKDFLKYGPNAPGPDLEPPGVFPETWGVML